MISLNFVFSSQISFSYAAFACGHSNPLLQNLSIWLHIKQGELFSLATFLAWSRDLWNQWFSCRNRAISCSKSLARTSSSSVYFCFRSRNDLWLYKILMTRNIISLYQISYTYAILFWDLFLSWIDCLPFNVVFGSADWILLFLALGTRVALNEDWQFVLDNGVLQAICS